MADEFALTAPASYQVFQRGGTTGPVMIAGVAEPAGTYEVEARFQGSTWTSLGNVTGGTPFNLTLSGQPQGVGSFQLRRKTVGDIAPINTVTNVGIGEIFATTGQSNASGRGLNNQTFTGTPFCGLYGNGNHWRACTDPVDIIESGDAAVSRDSTAGGTVWPSVATQMANAIGVPVGIVPCSVGSSPATDWATGAPLFDSCASRIAAVGGVRFAAHWQGETESVGSPGPGGYQTSETAVADSFQAIGVALIPCRLQHLISSASQTVLDMNQGQVNAAIDAVVVAHANAYPGPDLSGIDSEDATDLKVHLITDTAIQSAANLWWTAINADGQSQGWW